MDTRRKPSGWLSRRKPTAWLASGLTGGPAFITQHTCITCNNQSEQVLSPARRITYSSSLGLGRMSAPHYLPEEQDRRGLQRVGSASQCKVTLEFPSVSLCCPPSPPPPPTPPGLKHNISESNVLCFLSCLYFYPQTRWRGCLSQEVTELAFLFCFLCRILSQNISLSPTFRLNGSLNLTR